MFTYNILYLRVYADFSKKLRKAAHGGCSLRNTTPNNSPIHDSTVETLVIAFESLESQGWLAS